MSIRTSTTYAEMLDLMSRPGHSVYWKLEAHLLIDGTEVFLANVVSQNYISYFDTRYYGDNFIVLEVDTIVHKLILANSNNLQIELVKAQQSPDGLINTEVYRYSQIFNAHLSDTTNPGLMGTAGINESNGDQIDQASVLVNLSFQLVEPIIAEFRTSELGGIFKGVDVERLLRYALGYKIPDTATKRMLGDPRYTGIRGVDVVKPSNTRLYQHILIPNNTRLTDIPAFIQKQYGVYSSGIGWHIERGRCFIYPLYDYTQYEKQDNVITILNVPVNEAPTMERTFIVRENQLFIFATGNTAHMDESEMIQQNVGTGIRYSQAGDLIDGMADVSNNRVSFIRDKNVKAVKVDDRPITNNNNIRTVTDGFTDNPFKDTARHAESLGTKLSLQWDNANRALLRPGHPVKVLYKDGGEIRSLLGILNGIESITKTHTRAKLDNHYITTCLLHLFVKRVD